jgi:hypothetical protein
MAKKAAAAAPSTPEYSDETHDIVPIVDHAKDKEKGTTAMRGAPHVDIANHMAELAKQGYKTTLRYAAIRKPGYATSEKSSIPKTSGTPDAAKPAPKKTAAKPAAKPAAKKAAPKKAK